MTTITICSNQETLRQAADIEECEVYADSIAECVSAACRVASELGADCETDREFRQWHGGRYDQFGCRRGLVWVSEKTPDAATVALMDAVDDALTDALAKVRAMELRDQAEAEAERLAEEAEEVE